MPRISELLHEVFEVRRRLATRQVDDLFVPELGRHRYGVDVGLVNDDGNDKDLVFQVARGTLKGAVPFLDEEPVALADGILRDQRKKK